MNMTDKQIITKYLNNVPNIKVEGNMVLVGSTPENISDLCKKLYFDHTLPLKTAFATDNRHDDKTFKIYYVFGIPKSEYFIAPFISLLSTTEFPSLTPVIHELSWYEREIHTFFGLTPVGYPVTLQPLILHDNWPVDKFPLRKDFKWDSRPPISKANNYKFNVIKGEGIYELPVGPIHAGIIEPGHFRFSLAGEEIVSLEPQLGYVHKGIEKLFETLPLADTVKLSERVSGDSSFNHSLSYCQALEDLSDTEVPLKAQFLRVIFAELERLANHFNDFAFIMLDTAFTFGGSQGTRLRERVLQLNEKLTGSRFLRGVNVIGGVSVDIPRDTHKALFDELKDIQRDFLEVLDISYDSTSMMNRLKGSGILDKQTAIDHGVVGVAAKALGLAKDARVDYPYAGYTTIKVKVALQKSGDVLARYEVRVEEITNSFDIIKQAIDKLGSGPIANKTRPMRKNSKAVAITEGWRGDIVYCVFTDKEGNIARVVVRDPSYLNWPAVPYAVVGNPVPEFPLINKSFNLSYSGADK